VIFLFTNLFLCSRPMRDVMRAKQLGLVFSGSSGGLRWPGSVMAFSFLSPYCFFFLYFPGYPTPPLDQGYRLQSLLFFFFEWTVHRC